MTDDLINRNDLRSPSGHSVILRDNHLYTKPAQDQTSCLIARVHPNARRIEWINELAPDIQKRVDTEARIYAEWAGKARAGILETTHPLVENDRGQENWFDNPQYDSPSIQNAVTECPYIRDIAAARILDIGGTVRDSWRFIWHGWAHSVDHVDVSAETQAIAHARLRKLFSEAPQLVDRFTFHTTAAEQLPFGDATFDIVYARNTIHHTARPAVFHEIARVLRKRGWFMMLEPSFPTFAYTAMRIARRLRRVDRGTDEPIRIHELNKLNTILPICSATRSRFLGSYLTFFLLRSSPHFLSTPQAARLQKRIIRLDQRLSSTSVGRQLGHYVTIVARNNREDIPKDGGSR